MAHLQFAKQNSWKLKFMKNFVIFLLALTVFWNCQRANQTIQVESPYVFDQRRDDPSFRMPFLSRKVLPLISIAAVGDIMLGDHTLHFIKKYGADYPFDSTRKMLSETDIAFGNLEAPFTRTGTKFEKTFNFKVPPEHVSGLIGSGIDVVTLANNHMLDYGIEGLKNTLAILDSFSFAHCGAGMNLDQANKPAIIERNGLRVAFLGYSLTFPEEFWATKSHGGTSYPTEKNMRASIQHCDSIADFTVVTFHWGAEGKNLPKDYQKEYAHLAIDLGADLVLGHHPHVLQGLEIYKNRLIAYSLGNFTFSSYSRRAAESMILKVYLVAEGLFFAKIIPVSVDNYEISFQPKILKGKRAQTVIDNLKIYSEPLNRTTIIDDDGYIWGSKLAIEDSLFFATGIKDSSNNAN
jgi:poly-gamma-glutamate synthesis protein (capsule biosynthesis protein)